MYRMENRLQMFQFEVVRIRCMRSFRLEWYYNFPKFYFNNIFYVNICASFG
ncbi:unnamed protein product [Ixodes pacificus]